MKDETGLLVVGSIALDSVTTPTARAEDELGGSALYFAAAASLLAPVRIVGVVGEDFPWDRISFLSSRGVDTAGIEVAPGETFRWRGAYHEDMEGRDSLCTELNVFQSFRPEIPPAYRNSPLLFLGNIDPDLQRDVRSQVDAPRLTALDTMNFWIQGKRDSLGRALAEVEVVILNEDEACELAGTANLALAVRAVGEMGPRRVVVKRGPHGALLWEGRRYCQCPALLLEDVVDPTGAGDAFAGGFMGYLATRPEFGSEDFRSAVIYGNVLASFAVESFGLGGLAGADRARVEERRRELVASVDFRAE